ncbi:extracellular solute-binding protein [Pseudomonas sp. GCM10022188]|uniref:extracellular solute-binding protein n=1 Tax=Pseudomonas TaxID=286 RepID=UPI001E4E1699|nr:extracellular solute-binding protein [Pseudomonas oryzagri]MCC6076930.1 extracellular solute-binding protein [Pseudomonas oryzagri]
MMEWLKAVIVPLATMSSLAQAQEVLKVYNWVDYIDPAVVADFERESGAKVEYRQFATSGEMLASLEGGERFDVIVPTSDSVLVKLLQEKRLQPVRTEALSNYASVDPDLQVKLSAIQQAHRYVVPYMWGTVGLFVNTELVAPLYGGEPPNSWSLLFEPQQAQRLSACGLSLLNAEEEVFSIWFAYKGRSLGTSGPRRIAAEAPQIRNAGVGIGPPEFSAYTEQMRTGKVCAGMAWSGLVNAANNDGKLRYSIPVEGGLLFIDSLAIPANAPNPELAHRFINFMLAPENAVRNARAIDFTPSLDLSREEYRRLLPKLSVPSQEELRRLHFLEPITDKQKVAIGEGWQQYIAKP